MAYFVTGATGFIGRRLIELLLDKRQGKVYVLVRAGSTGRLDDLIERWGALLGVAAAKRVEPVIGDLRRPLLGVEAEQTAELQRQDRALLPPRGDLRHDRAGRAEHGDERGRHDTRGRAGAGAGGQAPAPRLLDRGRGGVQGTVRRGDVRRGTEAALALPPHEVRVRADRARAAVRALARVPPGGRGRGLADRRDGQGRRAVLLLQGDPAHTETGARVDAARGARPRQDERRAGRLGRRARSITSRTSPISTAAPST